MNFNRRQFIQTAAAVPLLWQAGRAEAAAKIGESGGTVRAEGRRYAWEWSSADDRFRILDAKGRLMASGLLQPSVVVQAAGESGHHRSLAGKPKGHEARGDRVAVTYEGVNGASQLTMEWRFGADGFWTEPVIYEAAAKEDIIGLHYFAEGMGNYARPTLEHNFLVLPGISESSALSPIVKSDMGLDATVWLGHGGPGAGGFLQQWALPTHYFCGFHRNAGYAVKGAMREHLSDAFCCGLAELPAGDLFFETKSGKNSPIVSLRGDLWGHLRGPGRFPLGARFYWAVGDNFYEAVRQYYLGLVENGVIAKKTSSARKTETVTATQFNTWGAEVAEQKEWGKYDQALLDSIYDGLKASGMKTEMFVVDAKWEGKYGRLAHDEKRLPNFERTIARIRADGRRFGMWAAFLRCEEPAELGLTDAHMLQGLDGKPLVTREGPVQYYLFDVTQPEVERALRELAKKFVRRYDPDLVKFDFGYELPALAKGRPKDMNWAGERLLRKGLDVVVGAMREEKPDLAVMYYALSPLFADYFDLHSPDDLFMCAGDYAREANRRFFFSSLLGELGMPTYGSGGYDWETMPEIWFDSAAVGTLGSLNSFTGDEENSGPTPGRVAKFNGLAAVLRKTTLFRMEPVGADYSGSATGARSPSWARIENGEPVLTALRPRRFDGGWGSGAYRDLVRTNSQVVVASKSGEGIGTASKLGVVPYGDGSVTIQRASRKDGHAEATEHYFGGGTKKTRLAIRAGALEVPLREAGEDGTPVEWVEIEI